MNEIMYSVRVLCHGQITDLSKPFSLQGTPFSVFIRPKTAIMDQSVIAKVRLMCDTEISDFPLPVNDWTPGAIREIGAGSIDLTKFDVYYGAGNNNKINN